jgi:hypothetical protein
MALGCSTTARMAAIAADHDGGAIPERMRERRGVPRMGERIVVRLQMEDRGLSGGAILRA